MDLDLLRVPAGADILLRDLIHERLGLFYDKEKGSLLTEKLAPLVIDRGFGSFLDYYYLLKYDEASEPEWRRVMDVLSVQETYFWREMDQVRALVDVLVPQWAAQARGEPLRIWCAACASGEEPLTIAIALNEAGWFDRIPIEISASDASEAALEKARRGLFRERAMRSLPPALLAKYFTEGENVWRIDPRLHARVRWARANLLNRTEIALLASVPFIFCRNVFIYFSADTIRQTVEVFADRMHPCGYLFVSAVESLVKISNDFELQEVDRAFVYRRNGSDRGGH